MNAVAIVLGSMFVGYVLISAIRTVVVPRPERVTLTILVFTSARLLVRFIADRVRNEERQERLLGMFAPMTLALLPAVWGFGIVLGFTSVFWGMDVRPLPTALVMSTWSLTTLGFGSGSGDGVRLVAGVEAFLGLGVIALMISFLPTIYGAFSRREIVTGRLTIRAGEPPDPTTFIIRSNSIGTLADLQERWSAWEEWFVELEETHTTVPSLVFFRSAQPGRTWIGAAEAALDTAAIVTACELTPSTGHAEMMIRAGFLSLNSLADHFRLDHDPSPGQHTAISVSHDEFMAVVAELEATGVRVPKDHEAAWIDYRGWRANYDEAVTNLLQLVGHVDSHWDRRRNRPVS